MESKKKYKPKRIQMQLLYRVWALLIVVVAILGFYQYSSMRNYLYESKIELLDARFKSLDKNVILNTNTEELLKRIKGYILYQVSGEDICVAIVDQGGELIATRNKYTGIMTDISREHGDKVMSIPYLEKSRYLQVLQDEKISSGYHIVKDDDGKKQIIILREIGIFSQPVGLVQISTYLDNVDEILFEQVRMYILSAIVVLFIGGGMTYLVLGHTLKPLKNMTNKLDRIDSKQLDSRIDTETGQVEIDVLARKFNSMLERIEKSFNKERQVNETMKHFILDVSHELRTPLTSIQGFVEVLQMGAAKNEKQLNMALDSIFTESKRLSKLVNQLLLLIKLENNIPVELKAEDMNEIIREIQPQLEILMKDRSLSVHLNEVDKVYVNKDQMKQVIFNLVQNGINHTDALNGRIEITTEEVIEEEIKWAKVSIRDNGEGISEENVRLIFDRFYRVHKHRSRKNGGHGLGLSIVQQIIYNHKGKIDVQSKLGKGCIFSFYIKVIG